MSGIHRIRLDADPKISSQGVECTAISESAQDPDQNQMWTLASDWHIELRGQGLCVETESGKSHFMRYASLVKCLPPVDPPVDATEDEKKSYVNQIWRPTAIDAK